MQLLGPLHVQKVQVSEFWKSFKNKKNTKPCGEKLSFATSAQVSMFNRLRLDELH